MNARHLFAPVAKDVKLLLKVKVYTAITKKLRGEFNKVPDFFVQVFKIVVDSWKLSILLLYILLDDWPIFTISGSNELEYTLLKPDCYS